MVMAHRRWSMPRVNFRIVRALAKRDLLLYFSNPTGYVFITLFIFLSAAAAFWQDQFFLRNLATLDQLNAVLPILLLFFVPALTMSVWSEEKRLGTDELLLTLPATDLEVVLGKYVATLGIYSASLLLAGSYVVVLFYLGSPDLGLMFSNYIGYWFAGGALIAVGMLSSLLTRNATIAFIVGAFFCGALILLTTAVGSFSQDLERSARALAVGTHFQDFAKGIISLTAVMYFSSVAAFFLYMNVLVLSRRHWPSRADGFSMWTHHAVRAFAVVAILVSIGTILTRANLRLDVTAEQLHTLSDQTRTLVENLPGDRPVFIQAYISPVVPEPYVQTRSNLISILEEIDSLAGPRVQVSIEDTEPFSDAALDARETYGIVPRAIMDVGAARSEVAELFLGLVFTSGPEEQVIGFFDRGLPAEYEIMRGIRVVAGSERSRVGVVKTMMDLVGGVDYQQNQFAPQWSVVAELRKQYEVFSVDPDFPISADFDAILVPLPSSLQTDQMANITNYIRGGGPALILVDPLPAVDPTLSPTEWVGGGNPYTHPPGTARPGPRGNVRQWLMELGIQWEPTRILWDSYNPHPALAHLQSEFLFLGPGNGNEATFNPDNAATSQLQELMLPFAGFLQAIDDPAYPFEPLVRSGRASGLNGYFSLVRASPFGPQLNPSPPREQDDQDYVVAARIHTAGLAETANAGDDHTDAGPVHMIVVADLDFIGEQFFTIREQAPAGLNFDNVTFFLNAIDTLVGDDSFIELRSRRAKHRTLERVEAQTAAFIDQRTEDEQQAEREAEEALTEAQARLSDRVDELRNRDDIDAQAMQIMVRNLERVENRRLEVLSTNIETEKQTKIRASRETMESQIRQIQTTIKTFAILLPPIPVFLGGVLILVRRQRREREGAALAHRLKD
jgi:ABC-2 type transport system permease protein